MVPTVFYWLAFSNMARHASIKLSQTTIFFHAHSNTVMKFVRARLYVSYMRHNQCLYCSVCPYLYVPICVSLFVCPYFCVPICVSLFVCPYLYVSICVSLFADRTRGDSLYSL